MSETIITRTCNTCKQEKPLSDFYYHKKGKRYMSPCKACKSAYKKRLYLSRSEDIKECRRQYRKTNQYKKWLKQYSTSEKRVEKQSKAHLKESRKQSIKAWKDKHPHVVQAKQAVHNAIRRKEIPPITTVKCNKCKIQADNYHHYLGYAEKHWLDVIPLCISCHKEAHKKGIKFSCL